jgi:hypothetical protein
VCPAISYITHERIETVKIYVDRPYSPDGPYCCGIMDQKFYFQIEGRTFSTNYYSDRGSKCAGRYYLDGFDISNLVETAMPEGLTEIPEGCGDYGTMANVYDRIQARMAKEEEQARTVEEPRWLVVWGFTDGREVGIFSSHVTKEEARTAKKTAEAGNDNPACGYWLRKEDQEPM